MYVRVTQRRNRDGSVVRYVQLAQNRRVNGRAQAEVVANLGREDEIDVASLRGLVASLCRYLDKAEPAEPPGRGAPAVEPPGPSRRADADRAPGSRGPEAAASPAPDVTEPPAHADRLIGRDRELADLSVLLSRHQHV